MGYLESVRELARRCGLRTHMDGARIFNAATAEGVDVRRMTTGFDSVSFCLSKGLGGPVGSLVCGSCEFIARALRMRKQLGGGMRQAGIIAAAGIYALENMVGRLAEDHLMARRLAEGIESIHGLDVPLERIRTNMVFFELAEGSLTVDRLVELAAARGLLFLPVGGRRFRMVAHYGLTIEHMDRAVHILQEVMGESPDA